MRFLSAIIAILAIASPVFAQYWEDDTDNYRGRDIASGIDNDDRTVTTSGIETAAGAFSGGQSSFTAGMSSAIIPGAGAGVSSGAPIRLFANDADYLMGSLQSSGLSNTELGELVRIFQNGFQEKLYREYSRDKAFLEDIARDPGLAEEQRKQALKEHFASRSEQKQGGG